MCEMIMGFCGYMYLSLHKDVMDVKVPVER